MIHFFRDMPLFCPIFYSGTEKNTRNRRFYGIRCFSSNADNRTRTCTVAHQILNLARLPIPPYPQGKPCIPMKSGEVWPEDTDQTTILYQMTTFLVNHYREFSENEIPIKVTFHWLGESTPMNKVKRAATLSFQGLRLFFLHERAGIRTPDNLIKSQVLYHLSYTPVSAPAKPENWASWIRTSDCRSQSPVPYRLAIAHQRLALTPLHAGAPFSYAFLNKNMAMSTYKACATSI